MPVGPSSDGPGSDGSGAGGAVVAALGHVRGALFASGVAVFAATLGALFLALLANVVLRYAFGDGLTWAYEIPSILFPWTVAAAVVIATALHRHIGVRLLAAMLPERPRRALAMAVHLVVGTVAAGVAWTSLPFLAASRFMRLSETGIAQVWGVSSLLYAFGAMALISAIDLVALALGSAPVGPADGAETSLS